MIDEIKARLQDKGKYWIAFVGDSLTSCEWVHPNWREIVEYVLKEELQKVMPDWEIPSWGIRCFNWGFDGATTRDIWEKSGEILDLKPDLAISLMGGNDPTLGLKPEETKDNIEKILAKFRENKVEVFWMTTLKELRETYNQEYEEYRQATLAVKTSPTERIFDMYTEYGKYDLHKLYGLKTDEYKDKGFKIDPGHPNQLGNTYIAKIVLKEVFGVDFDPEKYIKTTLEGKKYPEY